MQAMESAFDVCTEDLFNQTVKLEEMEKKAGNAEGEVSSLRCYSSVSKFFLSFFFVFPFFIPPGYQVSSDPAAGEQREAGGAACQSHPRARRCLPEGRRGGKNFFTSFTKAFFGGEI